MGVFFRAFPSKSYFKNLYFKIFYSLIFDFFLFIFQFTKCFYSFMRFYGDTRQKRTVYQPRIPYAPCFPAHSVLVSSVRRI